MPETAATTRSPTASGEPANPQSGTVVPVSVAALRDPEHSPVRRVEGVQDASSTESVDPVLAQGRRCARTGTDMRVPEPRLVAVYPHQLAGLQGVAGHRFVVGDLLLRIEEAVADRERRSARTDRARRHSKAGGDAFQSVLIRTP